MRGVEEADAVVVLPATYKPDWMERVGRKLKMEYIGMASVFTVIFHAAFGELRSGQSAIATAGSFCLFMGLKKKTRDHIVCSLLLFVAAALAGPAVTNDSWFVPYALFGACVWATEGYLEKRRGRICALPVVLGTFAAVSPLWGLALAFVAAYVLQPRPEAPGLRKRFAGIVAVSSIISSGVAIYVARRGGGTHLTLHRPVGALAGFYAVIAIVTLVCLAVYWNRLAWPHRVNAAIFGVLAALDTRVAAMFGIAATVLLSATIFRHGIDSDRWRPLTKHAEWYFFPVILVVALWTVFDGVVGAL